MKMTKIVFDLEQFKEWLKGIRSEKYVYEIDLNNDPIAILTRTHYYSSDFFGNTYAGTIVGLSGRVEE